MYFILAFFLQIIFYFYSFNFYKAVISFHSVIIDLMYTMHNIQQAKSTKNIFLQKYELGLKKITRSQEVWFNPRLFVFYNN